jgi:hypothetical protein
MRTVRLDGGVTITPPPGKADPHAVFWGGSSIDVPPGGGPLNASSALRRALDGRPPSAQTPLLRGAGGTALSPDFLDRLFEDVIRMVLPLAEADDYSNHSFRIGCATTWPPVSRSK